MRRALITGITGQDGSYLADLLISKGYEVHGLARTTSPRRNDRLAQLRSEPALHLYESDLSDARRIADLLSHIQPDEIYNLAALSHVAVSFDDPQATTRTNAMGAFQLLDAARSTVPDCRFFQASSSEIFGAAPPPQNENTACAPRSPYGQSKLQAHRYVQQARDEQGLFAVSGILFNHESARRGESFVTRKITRAVAMIHAGLAERLELGNLSAIRDWGYAPEYVEGMWLALQAAEPTDYVLATGEGHTVADFCAEAFRHVGLEWSDYVRYNADFERAGEVDVRIGDASKAEQLLGWKARTHALEIARIMVDADVASLSLSHHPGVSRH